MKSNAEIFKAILKIPFKFKIHALLLPALFIWKFGGTGVLYYILVAASVLVHEYAHVWMALKRDVQVVKVVLHAFGAMAAVRPENTVLNYRNEFAIAIAGPISSFVLSSIFLVLYFSVGEGPLDIFTVLAFMNLGFAVFNMLPMYPSDGGRILNSILSRFLGYTRAVKISTAISYVLAGTLGVVAAGFGQYLMLGVCVFVGVLAYINKRNVIENIGILKDRGVHPVR